MTRALLRAHADHRDVLPAWRGSSRRRPRRQTAVEVRTQRSSAVKLATKDPNVLVLTAPGSGSRCTRRSRRGSWSSSTGERVRARLRRQEQAVRRPQKQPAGEAATGCAFDGTSDVRFTLRWSRLTSTLTIGYVSELPRPGRQRRRHARRQEQRVRHPARLVSVGGLLALPRAVPGRTSSCQQQNVRRAFIPERSCPCTRLLPELLRRPTPRSSKQFFIALGIHRLSSHANVEKRHHRHLVGEPCPGRTMAPVDIGFVSHAEGALGGGPSYCAAHVFQTWVERDERWARPPVRVGVERHGRAVTARTAYPEDNGIDECPSLADKVGSRLEHARPRPGDARGRALERDYPSSTQSARRS